MRQTSVIAQEADDLLETGWRPMKPDEWDDDSIDHGLIADEDFIERAVDAICRRVNLDLIDEQGVATVVRMTFAHVHVRGYHLAKITDP